MKSIRAVCLLFTLFISSILMAQDSTPAQVGETFKIEALDDSRYSHLKLPRPNFIIKKGGIVDYSTLAGTLVTVAEVRTKNENETVVVLVRKDGKKFFGSFPQIKADYKKALNSGQISSI